MAHYNDIASSEKYQISIDIWINDVLALIGIFHYVIPKGYEMFTSLVDIL